MVTAARPIPTDWRVTPEPPLHDPAAAAALRDIHAFLDRERIALTQEYARICDLSIGDRIADGHALGPVYSLTSLPGLADAAGLGDLASLPLVRDLLSLPGVREFLAMPGLAEAATIVRFGRQLLDLPGVSDVLGLPGLGLLPQLANAGGLLPLIVPPGDVGRFREGQRCLVGPGAVGVQAVERGLPVEVVGLNPGSRLCVVQIDRRALGGRPVPSLQGPLVLDAAKMDLTDLYRNASEAALARPDVSPLVRSLALGAPTFVDHSRHAQLSALAADPARLLGRPAQPLNERQRRAFASLACGPVALVQGPPGIGKSYVLAEVVGQLAAEGKRVLVCALAHRAVNAALNKCAGRVPSDVPVVKYGAAHQRSGLQAVSVRSAESRHDLDRLLPDRSSAVVVGTCLARVPGLERAGVGFDVVVVDEASQLALPHLLCAAIAAPRAMLFGDHAQLPPITQAVHPAEPAWMRTSAFEALQQDRPNDLILLTESFRLNDKLVVFPSRFYREPLTASAESAPRRLAVSTFAGDPMAVLLDPSEPLVWALLSHSDQGESKDEADLAAALVGMAAAGGVDPGEIAVVSPYRRQNNRIRRLLNDELGRDAARHVFVDTVERIQGQEREFVIVSLVVGDRQELERNPDFIYSKQRLNVAVTRAKTKCIVIGSAGILAPASLDPKVVQGADLLRDLQRHCHVVRMSRDETPSVLHAEAHELELDQPPPRTRPVPSLLGRLLGRTS